MYAKSAQKSIQLARRRRLSYNGGVEGKRVVRLVANHPLQKHICFQIVLEGEREVQFLYNPYTLFKIR